MNNNQNITVLIAQSSNLEADYIDFINTCCYNSIYCKNGAEVMNELQIRQDINILLLDNLSDITAVELLKLIKEKKQFKNIPVVIASSDGDVSIVAACLKAGASDYWVKPLNLQCFQRLEQIR